MNRREHCPQLDFSCLSGGRRKTFTGYAFAKKRGGIIILFCFLSALIVFSGGGAVSAWPAEEELFLRAATLFNQGRYAEAIDAYAQAEKVSALPKKAIFNAALIYKFLGDYERAGAHFQRLLAFRPGAAVYLNLGEVYYLNAMPEKAIEMLQEALALDGANAYTDFWLGRCYEETNDREKAKFHYSEAARKDETMVAALAALGAIHQQRKNWKEAQAMLEKARDADPSIGNIYPALADSYLRQEKYEPALQTFRRIKSMDPGNVQAQRSIDEIFKITGSEFREELAERRRLRIAQSRAPEVIPRHVQDAPVVRVFVDAAKQWQFKVSFLFSIVDARSNAPLFSGSAQEVYTLVSQKNTIVLYRDGKKIKGLAEKVLLVPESGRAATLFFNVNIGRGSYWANTVDRAFRGTAEISLDKESLLRLINIVHMEEYLYGVLPSEMSSFWPPEALKTQAVAARSEAYNKLGWRHAGEGFDFCSEVHCQVYGGVSVEAQSTSAAVDETRGEIAVFDGKPIDAIYSNSCGGHTQGNIFADKKPIPYLRGRVDADRDINFQFPLSPLELDDWLWGKRIPVNCNNPRLSRGSNFRWMRIYKREELEKIINQRLNIGRLTGLRIMERGVSGHVERLEISGARSREILHKELEIRTVLGGLRSSMFNINVRLDKQGSPTEFIFYGGGWGHGVGMCQTGAAAMAQNGCSYREIIKFYYRGTEIKKMY